MSVQRKKEKTERNVKYKIYFPNDGAEIIERFYFYFCERVSLELKSLEEIYSTWMGNKNFSTKMQRFKKLLVQFENGT